MKFQATLLGFLVSTCLSHTIIRYEFTQPESQIFIHLPRNNGYNSINKIKIVFGNFRVARVRPFQHNQVLQWEQLPPNNPIDMVGDDQGTTIEFVGSGSIEVWTDDFLGVRVSVNGNRVVGTVSTPPYRIRRPGDPNSILDNGIPDEDSDEDSDED